MPRIETEPGKLPLPPYIERFSDTPIGENETSDRQRVQELVDLLEKNPDNFHDIENALSASTQSHPSRSAKWLENKPNDGVDQSVYEQARAAAIGCVTGGLLHRFSITRDEDVRFKDNSERYRMARSKYLESYYMPGDKTPFYSQLRALELAQVVGRIAGVIPDEELQ